MTQVSQIPQERLTTLYREGRLIRKRWSDTDAQGRQLLCLYTALAGNPYARPDTCPAYLAPEWIAHLFPWLDDAPSEAAWPGIVERVIALSPRLHEVSPACEWLIRADCVEEAKKHTQDPKVLEVCDRVISL